MAYSDWEKSFFGTNNGRDEYAFLRGDITGSFIPATDVGLTENESFSRNVMMFKYDTGGASLNDQEDSRIATQMKLLYNNDVDLSHNKYISIKARVRADLPSSPTDSGNSTQFILVDWRTVIGVTAYAEPVSGSSDGALYVLNDNLNRFCNGYTLALVKEHTETSSTDWDLRLEIHARNGYLTRDNMATTDDTLDTFRVARSVENLNFGDWYDIKFDIVPINLTSKVLKGYISSDRGITWSLLVQYTVNYSDSSRWRETGKIGIDTGMYAFNQNHSGNTFPVLEDDYNYITNFEYLTKTVKIRQQ